VATKGGNLSYIHKVKEGRDLYFFANSCDQDVDIWIRLRGKLVPELWNPHDGKTGPCEYTHVSGKGEVVTRVRVKLPPVGSVFLVAPETAPTKG
jgi:hypothetical protein